MVSVIIKYILQTTKRGVTRDLFAVSGHTNYSSVDQLMKAVIELQSLSTGCQMARMGTVNKMSKEVSFVL